MLSICTAAFAAHSARANDWPSFRHDQHRSGGTAEQLPADQLAAAWAWQSAMPPAPAWPDSARWDAYAKLDGLRSMRDYDPVFHPVIVGESVYIASNSDDTLRCLSLVDGSEKWRHTADGPIRVAPTILNQRVYFGCDDGSVRCLDSASGELHWKVKLYNVLGDRVEERKFVNDGRLCSTYPIRTGVVLDDDANAVIAGCGIFPWQETFLVSLDMATGKLKWLENLGTGFTLEGSMLLSSKNIIAPQGRSAPQLFSRTNGKSEGAVSGGGGSFVLLTENDQLMHGPGNKSGWITESNAETREKIASFDGGTAVVVDGQTTYLLSPTSISAIRRDTGQILWRSKLTCPHEVILAGDTLFAGGDDLVAAIDAASGELLWTRPVDGRAIGIAAANGRLVVSTDKGQITAFAASSESGDPIPSALALHLGFEVQKISNEESAQGAPGVPDQIESSGLLHQWFFHRNLANCDEIMADGVDAAGSADCRLESAIANGTPLAIPIESRFVLAGEDHAIVLDEAVDFAIADDFHTVVHPTKAFTAIATVRVDREQAWGGLVGISQDNGSYEKGWLLGFRNKQFGVAVNGVDGPDTLSWTLSDSPFQPGRWYHVAATYDGTTTRLFIDGQLKGESQTQSGDIDYPDAAGFYAGSYRDDDEHFFTQGRLNELAVFESALTADQIGERYRERLNAIGKAMSATPAKELTTKNQLAELRDRSGDLVLESGPEIRFVSPGTADIQWTTSRDENHTVQILTGDAIVERLIGDKRSRSHYWSIKDVDRNELITFRIVSDSGKQSRVFECDGHFDYTRPKLPERDGNEVAVDASVITRQLNLAAKRGMLFVFGSQDEGQLAEALSRQTGLDVVVVAADSADVDSVRRRLTNSGMYGRPVSVTTIDDLERVPPNIANVVVVADNAAPDEDSSWLLGSVVKLLKPEGKLLVPADLFSDAVATSLGLRRQSESTVDDVGATYETWSSQRRAGSAGWTHMYGSSDNSAYAGETLSEANSVDDLSLAWCGRPGPRYQSDRGNRKPSPLAAGGRLYLQGLHRLIGMDAHNGTILWSHELPEVVRFNVPRDCSNWCADEERLFLAVGDRCKVIVGATGDTTTELAVWNPTERKMNWGFVARHRGLLLGSCTQSDAVFTDFWGSESWYDAKTGENAAKVASDGLFAVDPASGSMQWNYKDGLVINPTITIAEDKILFVECRSKKLMAGETRRLSGDDLWSNLFVVALDITTGKKLWEQEARPLPGESALFACAAEGKFILQSSNSGEFAVYAMNLSDGSMLWRGKFDWEADHHGKHLSRPAIVGGKIFLRPYTLDVETGEVLAKQFPVGHQCGTYTASKNALFLRAGSLTMWDRESSAATRWNRVRPDCWISTIPAEGMLLSPEGGGGCSCGGWIETSMGFSPVKR